METKSIFKYYDSGRCPYCNSESIHIVEGEVLEYTLDKNALPDKILSREYTVTGFCKNCGKPVYVEPMGNGFYRVLPWNTMYIDYVRNIRNILGSKMYNGFANVSESMPTTVKNIDTIFFGNKDGEVIYGEDVMKLITEVELMTKDEVPF